MNEEETDVDNFTAARVCAWAEYRKDYQPNLSQIPASHKAFVAGWEAARDHFTAQEPSNAEVESAAAALVFADSGEPWQPEHMPARVQRRWLAHARAALIAARDARTG